MPPGNNKQIDTKYVLDLIDKGTALLEIENYKDAIACFKKAIEIEPNNSDAWLNKGIVLDILHAKPEDIRKCFDKALEINPNNAKVLVQKALFLYYAMKCKEADEYFAKAEKINPEYAHALEQFTD
jgi:tetratricopeptide (TPR) repeat protein